MDSKVVAGCRAVVLVLVLAMASSCALSVGGPARVDLSHDWSGVNGYVLADVNGLTTIVGIDTQRGQARPLGVLPARSDDDQVLAPSLMRGAGEAAFVAVPRSSNTSVFYQVDRGVNAVSRTGVLAYGGGMYPWLGGWVEVSPGHDGTDVRVLDKRLAARRSVNLPMQPRNVASDGADHLCLVDETASGARVAVVDLVRARAAPAIAVPAAPSALACVHGRPLVVVSKAATTRGEAAVPRVRRVDRPVPTLELSAGRPDGVIVQRGHAFVMVGRRSALTVLEVDTTSAEVVRTFRLPSLYTAEDYFLAHDKLVICDRSSGVIVDLKTGRPSTFALPGLVFPQ